MLCGDQFVYSFVQALKALTSGLLQQETLHISEADLLLDDVHSSQHSLRQASPSYLHPPPSLSAVLLQPHRGNPTNEPCMKPTASALLSCATHPKGHTLHCWCPRLTVAPVVIAPVLHCGG